MGFHGYHHNIIKATYLFSTILNSNIVAENKPPHHHQHHCHSFLDVSRTVIGAVIFVQRSCALASMSKIMKCIKVSSDRRFYYHHHSPTNCAPLIFNSYVQLIQMYYYIYNKNRFSMSSIIDHKYYIDIEY